MLKYLITPFLFLLFLHGECVAESVGYYKAFLTLIACQTDDNQPETVECQCNGTGKSGDGLGPCVCGDNCQCSKQSIDQTLKESEPVKVTQEPEIDLLYFSTTNCPPCNRVKTELNAMKRVGWKIGPQEDNHVILSNDYGRYGVTSFPCFILTVDGVPVKKSYGYMSRWQIAEFRKWQPATQTPVVGSMTVPGYRKPFEQATGIIRQMLGSYYRLNSLMSVSSPKRIEISIENHDGKTYITFHGDNKPVAYAAEIFRSEITHMVIEGNKLTVYWNGVFGLLKNNLTVEFE